MAVRIVPASHVSALAVMTPWHDCWQHCAFSVTSGWFQLLPNGMCQSSRLRARPTSHVSALAAITEWQL